ncbi:cation diffusion facilitator family transporter [Corynebacterium renale]|uniref:cation diffusion facilitator family transporter n=1 Tax=Corynebacterium renale TaxID=1724 RepID=UPI000DBE5CA4|nr:cation diffusion facilitator family transporter [Corynebacterium renale]
MNSTSDPRNPGDPTNSRQDENHSEGRPQSATQRPRVYQSYPPQRAHEHTHTHSHGPGQQHSHSHGADHHNHNHDHNHSFNGSLKALTVTLTMTATIFVAQVIGGLWSGSLALLSDAMHMLSDSTGLLIALVAILIGRKAATAQATFGYRRVEVIAALVNAVVVTGVSVWIVVRALGRLGGDHEIETGVMLIVAIVGLLANAVSALILMRRQHESLNMKGAYLHVLSDLLGSVAVIIAGIIIAFTGWTAADTIASLLIAALVLPRALKLLWTSLSVLLNRAPENMDTEEIEAALAGLPGVYSVHDLHVWSTDGTEALATCHLVLEEPTHIGDCRVLDAAQEKLREFGIEHSTIQLEQKSHKDHEIVC